MMEFVIGLCAGALGVTLLTWRFFNARMEEVWGELHAIHSSLSTLSAKLSAVAHRVEPPTHSNNTPPGSEGERSPHKVTYLKVEERNNE